MIIQNTAFVISEQTRKIDLNRLANNPDAIFELVDEVGSDFEFEGDEDDVDW